MNFSDPIYEENYQKEFGTRKVLGFHKFIIFELILGEIILIYNMISDEFTIIRMVLSLGVAILAFISIFIVKRFIKWRYMNPLLTIIHFAMLIMASEMICFTKIQFSPEFFYDALVYSNPIHILFCSLALAKIKWIYTIALGFIFNFHFLVRMYPANDHLPLAVIVHLLSLIAFGMMTYYQEASIRGFYKLINDSNKKLENFKNLIKNIIPTPIFIIDVENEKNEFCNNAGQNFLNNHGFSGNDQIFMELQEIMTKFKPLDSEHNFPNLKEFIINAELNKIFDKKDFFVVEASYEKEFSNSSNKVQFFQFKFLKLIWESVPCVLLMIDDISESFQIKELKNLNEYKNQLLATVSHDLRTPLNGMLGMIELVDLNLTDKKDKKNLKIAIASGQLLLNMINDILDFSQINNKKLRLNIKKFNIMDTIKETCKLIKFQIKSKGLKFIIKTHNLQNEYIFSDNNRVRQILLNLLSNALKFTQEGFIRLSIKKFFDSLYKGFVYKIKVTDSGLGIKQEDYPKIFKLFGKLEQENSNINTNGIGLGLTISQNLAQLLSPKLADAGIKLESVYGKGSKFWFFLEGEDTNDEILPPLTPYSPVKHHPYCFFGSEEELLCDNKKDITKKQLVLVVDDDMVNLMVAKRYCEYFEIDFKGVSNGAEAVAFITNNLNNSSLENLKGIFMDCNMPLMDGFKATETLIELWEENKKKEIPIVGMTANVLQEDLDKCIKSGMQTFLCKPVSRTEFGKALKNVFSVWLPHNKE